VDKTCHLFMLCKSPMGVPPFQPKIGITNLIADVKENKKRYILLLFKIFYHWNYQFFENTPPKRRSILSVYKWNCRFCEKIFSVIKEHPSDFYITWTDGTIYTSSLSKINTSTINIIIQHFYILRFNAKHFQKGNKKNMIRWVPIWKYLLWM
jgi:hypothetical protein